ncbi:DUF3574 domain-containing protein [Amycolatopsis sp. WGS_07]|uniref:DUF3574 domain-containing protein n=1 Tax=Amycolatopsis sp. WGS_07 TaxID=3076764 RepID=UPI003872C7B5
MRFSRRFVLTAATTASPDSSLWKRTELYFGTAKLNGGEVTEKEFADFSAKDITPRFPDGFAATGQWRSSSGAVVLEQIHTDYKHLFDQESVLRTDSTARVSF